MKCWLLILTFLSAGCAGAVSPSTEVTLKKTVLESVRVLAVLSSGIEGSADQKIITVAQAHQALDLIKPAVKVLKSTNDGGVEIVKATIALVNALPFASKIAHLLEAANTAATVIGRSSSLNDIQVSRAQIGPGGLDPTSIQGIIGIVSAFLPGILAFIKKKREEDGTDPTLEEVNAHIASEAEALINNIDNWEQQNPTS